MREKTELFQVNGLPLLAPDAGVSIGYEDLDHSASGRDEAGFMHRQVARYKVPYWEFSYAALTEEERQYMESLFPDAPIFTFTHPGRLNVQQQEQTLCYRSKYAISWRNARTGLWNGYSFRIIAC